MKEQVYPGHIHLLPEHIIDQIKAGEVIERPATLIKEIIENSIDAEATKIAINIQGGGIDLIQIEDNGYGMSHEDLPLAFCRHATSKISRFEDLYHLFTYGFRGEALASIASISKITCTSSIKNQPASTIRIEGGQTLSHSQDRIAQKRSGTSLYIKDLFYNTPARLKFIQSKTSEKNQIKKIINAFLLTQPDIEFAIKWDEGTKEFYQKCQNDISERIEKMFFNRKRPFSSLKIEAEYDQVKIRLYLDKSFTQSNAGKHQFIFVNNRYVQDTQLHKIILNSSSKLWPFGTSGHYFCYIDLPSDQIDANVHPNKIVVKFHRPAVVHSVLSNSIKKELETIPELARAIKSNEQQIEVIPEKTTTSFSAQEYSDFSYKVTDLDQIAHAQNDLLPTSSTESSPVIYRSENGRFIIYHFSNASGAYVLDLQKILVHKLWNYFESNFQSQQQIPLLVAAPLKNITSKSFFLIDILRQSSIEIDQLEQQTYALRTFPKSLEGIPLSEVLQKMIDLIENKQQKNLDDIFTYLCCRDEELLKNWDKSLCHKLTNNISIIKMVEIKAAKKLDNTSLQVFLTS